MSDKYKPFNLNSKYEVSPVASKLTAPFNLTAKYDPSSAGDDQYINTIGFLSSEYGQFNLYNKSTYTAVASFNASTFGSLGVRNQFAYVNSPGFNALGFGTPSIRNKNQTIDHTPVWWQANRNVFTVYGVPKIELWKRYVYVSGFDAKLFGTAKLLGGVKFVNNFGFNSSLIPAPTVVNTRADQYVNLNSRGIAAPSVPIPNVSPQILYAKQFIATQWGNPLVQFPPRPKGFDASLFGIAWISHSPRYLGVESFKGFETGYPKVFDPTQTIYHAGSPQIPGGIFGDISIRNTRRVINVPGQDHFSPGDWSDVYSNRRTLLAASIRSELFGETAIRNKTPSFAPAGFNSAVFGQALVAYRNRSIQARGIDFSESQRFGLHVLTKTPDLKPGSINPLPFGLATISNFIRTIYPLGIDTLEFSDKLTAWFRYRYLKPEGFAPSIFGPVKIEHDRRELIGRGYDSSGYGRPTVWYRVRNLAPASIYREFESNHQVGGTQHIKPKGFDAAVFGSRIVPENQAVYPLGFANQAFSELNKIELSTRWVRASGFTTYGQQPGDRYGTPKVWNKRQYITQVFDAKNGLNPGEFGQWTVIANRNRVIGAVGNDMAKIGYQKIDNNARPLSPTPITSYDFGKPMIAYRIRTLSLAGMEPPYISGWVRVVNAAEVIAPKSSKFDVFGSPSVENTRRNYRWVGAFESLVMGVPMIDFAIRTISIPGRYSIQPPYLALPKVDLHTRYIEPQGFEPWHVTGVSLHIKWNIITTRWTHREFFGDSVVHNRTPELKQRGNVTEEFGKPSLRTQWRQYFMDGFNAELIGRHSIAYRDRSLTMQGFNNMGIGLHKVIKTGAPPYSLQTITLDWGGEGVRPDDFEGKGIAIPIGQVPKPDLKTNVLFASGFTATEFGSHHLQSNGILMDAGIQEFAIGNHTVYLKNQSIAVESIGDLMDTGKPRLNPWTIYAVVEAPAQAQDNHTYQRLHFVNSDGGSRKPGEVFGNTRITLQHRMLGVFGLGVHTRFGNTQIRLVKNYIRPEGIRSFRMGWHVLLDGRPQYANQFNSLDQSIFGQVRVYRPVDRVRYIRPSGFAGSFGQGKIEFFHRTIRPVGNNMGLMGASGSGDTPYKPQRLWVGEPKPTIPTGFESEIFGNHWISLKVRDISVEGFNSFISELDVSNFKGRMKITLVKKPVVIEPKQIVVEAFDITTYGVPNIRLKTHYIRPDGNSDQYRKGAPK
ncbi:hypothetical protein [Acinetobacter towneri]|uniref:hypothetical protein n=1 Tax=Acinetobacter towneri TaxID=202956 RepID=UPI0034D5D1F8